MATAGGAKRNVPCQLVKFMFESEDYSIHMPMKVYTMNNIFSQMRAVSWKDWVSQ